MLSQSYPSSRPIWDLFHFVDGSRTDHQRVVDFGVDPWWTHPEFRLSLLRPLPSLLTALDEHCFAMRAELQHLHSFVWWALLLGAATLVLFTLLPPTAAACAVILFGVEESFTVPVLWISNRNALIATTFVLGSLYCHLRWRGADGTRAWRAAGIGLFALALACGEYALAATGYVFCLELAQPPSAAPRFARALAPYGVLIAMFLALSTWLGYGSAHSALYTSPFSAPTSYLEKLSTGLPTLLGDLTLGISADHWHFGAPAWLPAAQLHNWHVWQVWLGVLGAALSGGLLYWLTTRVSASHARALRCLFVGAVLGLLPVLGSFVTTRLAMPSSLGFAAVYGSALAEAGRVVWARAPLLRAAVALGIAVGITYVHGYRAWLESRRTTEIYSYVARSRTAWSLSLDADATPSDDQLIVMIAAADANDAPHLPFVRHAWQKPRGRGFRLLSGAPSSHEIKRVDSQTLEVRVLDEAALQGSMVGSLTRDHGDAIPVGQITHVAGLRVEVLEVAHGQPVRFRCHFDVPLDDPSLFFIQSTPQGLRKLQLPRVGEQLHLPAAVMPDLGLLMLPMAAPH